MPYSSLNIPSQCLTSQVLQISGEEDLLICLSSALEAFWEGNCFPHPVVTGVSFPHRRGEWGGLLGDLQ